MKKLFALVACHLSLVAFSSSAAINDINIKADKQVEWHQKENKMVAVGNAVAAKNDMSIKADELIGYYENIDGKNSLKTMHAVGSVIMSSEQTKAFGDTMDYDLKKDEAVLKGRPAQIKTDAETIEAADYIIYYPGQNKAIARGQIVITDKEKNKIYSDSLDAFFKKNSQDKLGINKVDINDNVKIITKDAVITAKRGTYLPQTGTVHLYENVVITQAGGNVLRGEHAESNLDTGISKLISDSKGGRVTGVFKEKTKE